MRIPKSASTSTKPQQIRAVGYLSLIHIFCEHLERQFRLGLERDLRRNMCLLPKLLGVGPLLRQVQLQICLLYTSRCV